MIKIKVNENSLIWSSDQISPEDLDKARKALDILSANCSKNLKFEATLTEITGDYEVRIVAVNGSESLDASSEDSNFLRALQNAELSLVGQMRNWSNAFDFLESEDTLVRGIDRRRVLIVDDNPVTAILLDACFVKLGCSSTMVTGGMEAVLKLMREDFDLLVLDWSMPQLDGAETLKAIQKNIYRQSERPELERDLPVIIYSGSSSEEIEIPECPNIKIKIALSKGDPPGKLISALSEVLLHLP